MENTKSLFLYYTDCLMVDNIQPTDIRAIYTMGVVYIQELGAISENMQLRIY